LSPQPPKLFANETLYQLSYTPNLIDFSELHGNLRSKKDALSIPVQTMKANGIDSATKRSTSQFLRSILNVSCLKRHELNENYYAIKRIRGKVKTHALRSESSIAITDRKVDELKLRGLEREDEALSILRAFFQIICQPICHRFFASSSCVQQRRTRRL
jgi:hypothetical protein